MICPVCNREYVPVLKPTGGLVQVVYPEAEKWEREQLLTGICSQVCWDRLFKEEEQNYGVNEEESDHDQMYADGYTDQDMDGMW